MSPDRYNLDYATLVETQQAQLAMWALKLLPDIWQPVAEYVRSHNKPAPTPNDKHQVLRGQDIVQIIMDWPCPGPAYPQRGEDLI